MKTFLNLLILAGLLSACSNSNQSIQKVPKEVSHIGENVFEFDSLYINGKDSLHVLLALEPIPNHFIMTGNETDSFLERHIYDDQILVLHQNDDRIIINKDSLLPFINEAYLNEALIEKVNLMLFEPNKPIYLIEFAVKKPNENFSFHFQVLIEGKHVYIDIVDE